MKNLLTILLSLLSLNAIPQAFAQTIFHERKVTLDTVKVIILFTDNSRVAQWDFAYDVRELKNSVHGPGPEVICCVYYWEHVFYLDEHKMIFPACNIVWGAKDSLWERPVILQNL